MLSWLQWAERAREYGERLYGVPHLLTPRNMQVAIRAGETPEYAVERMADAMRLIRLTGQSKESRDYVGNGVY